MTLTARTAGVVFTALALVAAPALVASKPKTHRGPADGKGAYATGRYRNLFVEAGRTPKEVDAKIEAAYRQLFHGDPETELLFFPAGRTRTGRSPTSPTSSTPTCAPRACRTG